MKEQRRPIPEPTELLVALEALVDLQLDAPPRESKVASAAPVLTLECAGGPDMPSQPVERDERLQAVREVLREQVRRFAALSESELRKLSTPPGESPLKNEEQFQRERQRLEDAASAMFQLNLLTPDTSKEKEDLWAAASSIWGKPPGSRWYERSRHKFVRATLAGWLIEYERAYRETPRPGNEEAFRAEQSTGKPDLSQADTAAESPKPQAKRRQKALLVVAALAAPLVIWLASGLFSSSGGESVPIEQQITDDIPEGGTVRMLREVRLHDAATNSYFAVVRRPPPSNSPRRDQLQPWDELRVYDQENSDAQLQFAGQPVSLVGGAPTVKHGGRPWGSETGRMYQFTLLGIHDTNDDGRAEIYGSLRDQVSDVARPLAVEWDDIAQEYKLIPLIPTPPKAPVYGEAPPGLGVASYARRESRTALSVSVAPNDHRVRLYGATEVSLRQVPSFGWVLISGYGAVSGRKTESPDLESRQREIGRGSALEWTFGFSNVAAITHLTVEVAPLLETNGLVKPAPCEIYATTRLRLKQPSGEGALRHPPPPPRYTQRIVPKLMTNALVKDPLDPQRLDLPRHLAC